MANKPTPRPGAQPKDAPPRGARSPNAAHVDAIQDAYRPRPRPGVPPPKPGHPPLHRIPIVDHKGNMRGHVGHSATQATVARFLGRHGAKLGEHEGRTAWIGDTPPPPPPPEFVMGPSGPTPNPKALGRPTDRLPPDQDPKMIALKMKGESEAAKAKTAAAKTKAKGQ